jgi:hypothetical protein
MMGKCGGRGNVKRFLGPALIVLLAGITAVAASPPSPPPPPGEGPGGATRDSEPLARVAAVGASATHGFFAQILVDSDGRMQPAVMDLGDALAAVLAGAEETTTAASTLFFRSPDEWADRLLAQARRADPTTLVAIDYLFWFGYGQTGHRPGTDADAAERRERLDRGLARLATVRPTATVVVGDLPDMSAAVGRMLSAGQVPDAETRADLNRRIRDWTAERPHVVLVSLNDIMRSMQAGDRLGVPGRVPILKPDRLHPTADGLVVLAREIARRLLEERPDITGEMVELDHEAAIERLRRRLAARLEASAAAPTTPAPPTAPAPVPVPVPVTDPG